MLGSFLHGVYPRAVPTGGIGETCTPVKGLVPLGLFQVSDLPFPWAEKTKGGFPPFFRTFLSSTTGFRGAASFPTQFRRATSPGAFVSNGGPRRKVVEDPPISPATSSAPLRSTPHFPVHIFSSVSPVVGANPVGGPTSLQGTKCKGGTSKGGF